MNNLLLFFLLIKMNALVYSHSDEKQLKLIEESKETRQLFLKTDPSMASLFDNSLGSVIFPNVAKAAVGIGGAIGKGVVYENGKVIGTANIYQVSVGSQAGGQVYREIIFFEDKNTMNRFKENKVEFSAQVSAVAAASGVGAVAKYIDGVAIYTLTKGGLMYEASIGGQKFQFNALIK